MKHHAYDFDQKTICGVALKDDENNRLPGIDSTPVVTSVDCPACRTRLAECFLIQSEEIDEVEREVVMSESMAQAMADYLDL